MKISFAWIKSRPHIYLLWYADLPSAITYCSYERMYLKYRLEVFSLLCHLAKELRFLSMVELICWVLDRRDQQGRGWFGHCQKRFVFLGPQHTLCAHGTGMSSLCKLRGSTGKRSWPENGKSTSQMVKTFLTFSPQCWITAFKERASKRSAPEQPAANCKLFLLLFSPNPNIAQFVEANTFGFNKWPFYDENLFRGICGALKGILDVVRKDQALQVSRSNKRASSPHFKSSLCHCHPDLAFQKRQLNVSLITGKCCFIQIFFLLFFF